VDRQVCIPLDGSIESGELLVHATRTLGPNDAADLQAPWVLTSLQLDVPFTAAPVDLLHASQ